MLLTLLYKQIDKKKKDNKNNKKNRALLKNFKIFYTTISYIKLPIEQQ